MQVNE